MPQWIVLGGFLKLFPTDFSTTHPWRDNIINIHPSLLPKFGGKGMYGDKVHKAVIASKEKKSGATVHFVNAKYDEGSIISQCEVPVFSDDCHESLGRRVFDAESFLYPQTLAALVNGKLPLSSGKAKNFSKEFETIR